jgi:hypothetical protein
MERINETKKALEVEANALIETHLRVKKLAAIVTISASAEQSAQLRLVAEQLASAERSIDTAATHLVQASTLLGKAP